MGYVSLAAAIQYAVTKENLAFTAKYVPPDDETMDGEIELRPADGGAAPMGLQIGPYGGSLNRYEYRKDGELTGMAMVKNYDRIATAQVCSDIVAELKVRK